MEADFREAVSEAVYRHRQALRRHWGMPRSDGLHIWVKCGCNTEFLPDDWHGHLQELCSAETEGK